MNRKFITKLLTENLEFLPTQSQLTVIERIADFFTNEIQDEIFLLKGYAGTGKTTLIKSIVKTFSVTGQKCVLLAPTGRASKVIANISGKQSFTIHKKIYRQVSSKDGFGKFNIDKNLHTNTIFIVDEASMISNQSSEQSFFGSGKLLDDLLEYVYSGNNCKLILIGDTAQLPPVGLEISPALDNIILNNYGFSVIEATLTDIVRHSENSGILKNATIVRNKISLMNKQTGYPKLKIQKFTDILKITGDQLIESINEAYDKFGQDQTIIISRSNKRTNQFNEGIRKMILWREDTLCKGDMLMIVKNNYFWNTQNENLDFIANGDIACVTRINGYEERYGYKFCDVSLYLIDYEIDINAKIILDTLKTEGPSLSYEEMKKMYISVCEDYPEITAKKALYEKVKVDPFFNALQVKYSYAVTCHKAQGGQWDAVFVDQGYLTDEMFNREYLRWLYTAITRASQKLYLINFSDKFFDQ